MTTLPTPRSTALDRLALALIGGYQRYLSPYKGFRCACAALHGGPSCSAAVARIVRTQGLYAGRADIAAQFARCRGAYTVLRTGFGGSTGGDSRGGGSGGGTGPTGGNIGGQSREVGGRGPVRGRPPQPAHISRTRRGGVQGVFCCGPVPIPFRCG